MPHRPPCAALVPCAIAAICLWPSAAAAHDLPLGPSGLPETRQVATPAAGVTETEIVRGEPSDDDAYVVDVGFTASRADADGQAARLRADGVAAEVVAADVQPPDAPLAVPRAYFVRVGRFPTAAAAQPVADGLTARGYARVRVSGTAEDGAATTGPWRIHVLDIDPRRFHGTVAPVLATGVVPFKEPLTAIAARVGAVAAVNGGYFVVGSADGTPGDLAGISVLGGRLVSEAVAGRTSLLLPKPDGADARVAPVSTIIAVRAGDGARRELDGRNRTPGLVRGCGGVGGDLPTERPLHDVTCTDASELVQYTPDFGPTADPAARLEAALDARGRVLALRSGGGAIPSDGSVLGATGDAVAWLQSHARPGSRVRVRVRIVSASRRVVNRPALGIVNGGPRLLAHGRVAITAAAEGFSHPDDPSFYYGFAVRRNPRTLAGVTPSGHLLLVAVDGRAPGYSVGLGFEEAARLMRALGATEALNLDGGGSTSLTFGQTLLTRPSDTTGERPLGDAIVLRARSVAP